MIESRSGGGAGAALPFDPKETFGRSRAPVRVSIDEHEPFRTTVAIYDGIGWIGLRKAQLAELDLHVGDRVEILVELDEQPRGVEVPVELAQAMAADPAASMAFESLSHTHRKEYARWVADAKRAPTRTERATKAVGLLRSGVRTPR